MKLPRTCALCDDASPDQLTDSLIQITITTKRSVGLSVALGLCEPCQQQARSDFQGLLRGWLSMAAEKAAEQEAKP